ncbi:MAG: extracellular solute-binding protein [Gammaproteobacteria bacterium]|nr:extracellular solute-binding protein [Gammaproteobacteria bacterium]
MRMKVVSVTAATIVATCAAGCLESPEAPHEVVVYSSVDEIFARPIAQQFKNETGIQVRLVPDTEETKSTGLLNRLMAEKARPQADVFWSGDPVRAAILKSRDISEPYRSPQADGLPVRYSDPQGHWAGFSARARVLIYNTSLVPETERPTSVMDLLDSRFRGSACLANPLFGTTSMHAAALFQVLGEVNAREFFTRFIENGGTIVSSNGEVRRRVAAGDFAIGITDTDDFNVALRERKPVGIVYPDHDGIGTLVIPNAAVLIAGAPNPEGGKRFIDFLLSPETEEALAHSAAAQMPVRSGIPIPAYVRSLTEITPMQVDYDKLADELERLSNGFLREWVTRHSR